MSDTVNLSELNDALKRALNAYVNDDVIADVKDLAKKEGKKANKELRKKNAGTFKDRTGRYRKGWRFKVVSENSHSIEVAVYNKTDYQLTHLLENGHVIKNGTQRIFGKSKAFPHIAEVNKAIQDEFEKKTKTIIQNGG